MEIKDILGDLGYTNLQDYNQDFRHGKNVHLSINKQSGVWYNFKTNSGGSLLHLVKDTLNISTDKAKQWLKDRHNFTYETVKSTNFHDTLNCPEFFDEKLLNKVIPNHDYWTNRGISPETMDLFKGGVVSSGRMFNRYVFPIYNSRKQIVGFTGRTLNEHKIKWFHRGNTSKWVYPAFLNLKYLRNKQQVIFVEGIGDMLKLWECGIKNVLVNFGLNINNSLLSFLFKIRPNKIYLAFDNDESKAGYNAAVKAKENLQNHFDSAKIKISLPTKNDFGEMSDEEIRDWKKEQQIL